MVTGDREKPREQLLDEVAELRRQLVRSREEQSQAHADEELYSNVVGAVREPLLVLDANLLVILASQAFSAVFQMTPGDTQGQYLYDLGRGQWNIPRLIHLLQEVLPQQREVCDFELEHDFPGVGHKRLLLNARQIYQSRPGSSLILLAIEDVTQRRQDEKAVHENEEIMQRNSRLASIGLLASGITHEINNPLGIIMGYAELALQQPLNEPTREYLEIILEATDRAARVVHNVLSFARDGSLDTEVVDVRTVLERAIGLKSHEFAAQNIQVRTDFYRQALLVSADPFQLVEAVLNIVTNAQHAMTGANGGGQIEVNARPWGDRVRISIADNGPGIPPEHLDRIFDPFFTTKEPGQGTGLGLSVTHGIISQHGGDICVESVQGQGTTINIELPRSPLKEEKQLAPAPPQKKPENTIRVLAVNDEPAFRQILSFSLSADNCRVERARNGEEAWEMVQSQHYDCIILNLWMPKMGGQDLYRRIKESSADLARRCIFITGATHGPEVEEFIVATGNPYLTKPFHLEEVRRLVLELAA
jgi:signal transduction histidine kinase/CheY-like chemotaxis protein